MNGSFLEVPKSSIGTVSPRRSVRKLRPSIDSSPITGMMQDRYNQLLNEFKEIDKDSNEQIDFEELHQFLSKKQKSSFDINLCRELFSQIDTDHDNIITIDEFLWSYVKSEDVLNSKIKDLKKFLHENLKKIEEYQKKLLEAKSKETLNRYNIMKGSVLTVSVIEAKDLVPMDANGFSDPYVILECENQKVQSKYIPKTLNPIWNEEFTFNIETGTGDLKVTVMDKDNIMQDDFEGEVCIPLSTFQDQMKHDQIYYLDKQPDSSKKSQARIHLCIQWIWSKTKYFEDIIIQWEKVLDADKKELNDLEEQLSNLKKPFGHLDKLNQWTIQEEKSFSTRKTGLDAQVLGSIDFAEQRVLKHFDKNIVKVLVMFLYAFNSIIVMFSRPDFFNVNFS
jgi:C2 domain/EF-hand domain pair